MLGYAREILNIHRVAKRAVSDLVDLVTGDLTIGASFTVGEYVLPRILAGFTRRYPDVKFTVTIGNTEFVHEHAREDSIDVGLVEGAINDPHLEIKRFLDDELILIASKNNPLAGTTISPKDIATKLKDIPFIIREEGSGTRLAMDKALAKLNYRPPNLIVLGSTQAIKESVEANLGVSLLSKWTLRKEIKLGSIKPIRYNDPFIRGFYLVKHKGQFESRACSEFVKFILEQDLAAMF